MNYALNPDAPEFHPLLTNAVKDGLMQMNKTIRTSNCFPRGASYDIYKTYTDYGIVTGKISRNVVTQSNQIVGAEFPQVKLKSDVKVNDDDNTDKIINVNDSLLDRININIDSLNGANQPNEIFLQGVGANVSPWNKTPVISKIRTGAALFIGAKNLPRPQFAFKDTVDNSSSLWVPKIFDKPNNLKPLSLNIIYNSDKIAVGYEHPYSLELEMYEPPLELILPAEEPSFPLPLDDTPLTIIDTEPGLDTLIEHLKTCTEIAVDLEHHQFRSYQGITCIMQITTDAGGDFIVDTIAIREYIYKLNEIFTDPKIIKVFHGASSDVKWLQRDFGVYIVGLFDTYHAGRALHIPVVSLRNLMAIYCKMNIDKTFQLADWRIRPLPAEMIEYARTDTHYLLYVYRMMKLQLMERSGMMPKLLLSVFENSRQTSYLTYSKPLLDADQHLEMYTRSQKRFTTQQLTALRILYIWRDHHARELDEGPSYLIPNHMMLNLAEHLPRDLQGICACCMPMPGFVKIHLLELHKMILSCRELPVEPVLLYKTRKGVVHKMDRMDHKPEVPVFIHDLIQFADIIEDDIDLEVAWALLDEANALRILRLNPAGSFAETITDAAVSEGAVAMSEGAATTMDYAAEASEGAATTMDYAAEASEGAATTMDYAAEASEGAATTMDYAAEASEGAATTMDYAAEATEGAATTVDYAAEASEGDSDASEDATVTPEEANLNAGVKSKLNVDAKMFIPPFDRFRRYRARAQVKDIKEMKDKEAVVAALSRGNELIKIEVLLQLQEQRDAAEASAVTTPPRPATPPPGPATTPPRPATTPARPANTPARPATTPARPATTAARPATTPARTATSPPRPATTPPRPATAPEEPAVKEEETAIDTEADKATDETKKVSKRRHRGEKPAANQRVEKPAANQPADDKKKEPQKSTHEHRDVIKSFHYKNVNYKKFLTDDKAQPKLKFKKS